MADKICFIISMLHKNHLPSLSTIWTCAWEEIWRVVLRRIRLVLYKFAFGTNISLFKSQAVRCMLQCWQFIKPSPQHLLLQSAWGTADRLPHWQEQKSNGSTNLWRANNYVWRYEANILLFAKEIKLAKPLKVLTNLPDRALKQSWDLQVLGELW